MTAEQRARLVRAASGFPEHNDRDGVGWVNVRWDDLNAILAAFADAPGVEDKLTMTISLTEREQAALDRLMKEQELSGPQVFRCALRSYQSDHERRKAGETVTWSGDTQRARDFAGDLATPKPSDLVSREAAAKVADSWKGDEAIAAARLMGMDDEHIYVAQRTAEGIAAALRSMPGEA